MGLTRIQLAVGIAAVAALAAALALLVRPPAEQAVRAPREPSLQSSPFGPAPASQQAPAPEAAAAAATSPPPPPALPPAVSARLQAELFQARDWRVFVLAAKQRPEEGGYYYAKYIANLCGGNRRALQAKAQESVADAVRTAGTVEPERLKVVEDLASRCASFIPGEAAQIWKELASKEADGRDPLVLAERRVLKLLAPSSDPAMHREAATVLLANQDPLLWSQRQLLTHLMSEDPQARKAGGLFFEGKTYTAEDDAAPDLAMAAWLTACGENVRCALDDIMVARCIAGHECAGNARDYLRLDYLANGGTADGYARILALEQRIRAAVLARSVASFVR